MCRLTEFTAQIIQNEVKHFHETKNTGAHQQTHEATNFTWKENVRIHVLLVVLIAT